MSRDCGKDKMRPRCQARVPCHGASAWRFFIVASVWYGHRGVGRRSRRACPSVLYAEDAQCTPASSPFRRDGQLEIKTLWASVAKSFPTRQLTLRQISVRVYGPTAVETGYFDFTGVDGTGVGHNISGRYSTTSTKLGDKWLIVDHHVSQLPPSGPRGPAFPSNLPTLPLFQAP